MEKLDAALGAPTAYCGCCNGSRPFSIRHNGGVSFDLCCDACHFVVTTFNNGHPFAAGHGALAAAITTMESLAKDVPACGWLDDEWRVGADGLTKLERLRQVRDAALLGPTAEALSKF